MAESDTDYSAAVMDEYITNTGSISDRSSVRNSGQIDYGYVNHRKPPQTAWANSVERRQNEDFWRNDYFGPQRLGGAPVTFTGPDGLGPHRVAVDDEHRYVGNGEVSWELSGDASYLWRPASTSRFPKPKSAFAGAIGWGVGELQDLAFVRNRTPIKMGFSWQIIEDRDTHLGQSAWCEPCTSGYWKTENHVRTQSAPISGSNNSNNNSGQQRRRYRRYDSQVRY